jgi:hypothetical protein
MEILKGYLKISWKGFVFSWVGENNKVVIKKIKIMIKEVEVLKRYLNSF